MSKVSRFVVAAVTLALLPAASSEATVARVGSTIAAIVATSRGNAVAYDPIPPPLAIFLAAIPLVKLLEQPRGPWPVRMVADMLEGAAKPVGGDAEATVRLAQDSPAKAKRRQHPRQGRPPTPPKTPRKFRDRYSVP